MKKFTLIIVFLIVLTLVWLGLIINVAFFYFDHISESKIILRDISLQFKVIYFLGIALNIGFLSLIILRKDNQYF
ncbi:hypothetical protein SAMN05444337_0933 [Flavobacterium haoranii]|uniref:Uncharacterized protein n=1 Tax=Flavobacterium haoranii TaxID=683124 RepID=A0A1M6EFK2_9FLAO|nr:hypothetical protein SAMN05444337_0933 [Flavobacterium haoranii]